MTLALKIALKYVKSLHSGELFKYFMVMSQLDNKRKKNQESRSFFLKKKNDVTECHSDSVRKAHRKEKKMYMGASVFKRRIHNKSMIQLSRWSLLQ